MTATRETATLAAITAIGTALVLAPIDPQPIRDLNTPLPEPEPESAPAFDEALFARVRNALGLKSHFRAADGETPTRFSMWDVEELNAPFTRTGGTVTAQQVERPLSDGRTFSVIEVTITVDLPGIGTVEVFTDWDPSDEPHGFALPVILALNAPKPEIVKTVPANGSLLGYEQYAIAPGGPLPDGRTIATVEDPLGSAWRVADDQGAVHWLHKYGELIRYTNGVVAFREPEWAGWSSD